VVTFLRWTLNWGERVPIFKKRRLVNLTGLSKGEDGEKTRGTGRKMRKNTDGTVKPEKTTKILKEVSDQQPREVKRVLDSCLKGGCSFPRGLR